MLVSIRDDDTNYFTSPNDLKQAYGEILGTIPITFSVIPFVSCHYLRMLGNKGDSWVEKLLNLRSDEKNLEANEIGDAQKVYPIGDNQELVNYLANLVNMKKAEIALHGFTHRYYEDGAECTNWHINYFNIRDGSEYLCKIFNSEINFFVPPSNTIDFVTFKSIAKLKLALLTSSSIRTNSKTEKIELLIRKIIENPNIILKKLRKIQINHYTLCKNFCLQSKTFRLDDTANTFLERALPDMERSGYMSIATHYMPLRDLPEHRRQFKCLLDMIQQRYCGTVFVTAKSLKQELFESGQAVS